MLKSCSSDTLFKNNEITLEKNEITLEKNEITLEKNEITLEKFIYYELKNFYLI
jgi:uncharacterized protein YacL (UPF0231 family)